MATLRVICHLGQAFVPAKLVEIVIAGSSSTCIWEIRLFAKYEFSKKLELDVQVDINN